jgi:hypothetical protein
MRRTLHRAPAKEVARDAGVLHRELVRGEIAFDEMAARGLRV